MGVIEMACGKNLVCNNCGNDDCSKFEPIGRSDQAEYQCTECGTKITECK